MIVLVSDKESDSAEKKSRTLKSNLSCFVVVIVVAFSIIMTTAIA